MLQPSDTNVFESMNLNQMFTPLIAMILPPFYEAWCLWIKCSISGHNNGLLRFFSTLVHFVDDKTIKNVCQTLLYMSHYGNSLLGSQKAWQQI